ncbi:MAG: YbhB/YbcL family Raf kinase inhibitor-like protein [Candidatus Andersenbacteria bacterium]|nr:YbhB/YbcL family Raf kinase inhibitor-like protein [bacterium]MDZ4225745.1 YbhB/YbcL family Raf kinase inhibitor-like protein [Candidatus Andersenbacteria bacterium]
MQLISTAFDNKTTIPARYTCDGQNINPPLEIKDVPTGAKSLAIIINDPDAPSGNFIHWVIWNINPATAIITANSTPLNSIQGQNSSDQTGYTGPCPPSGTHRYYFTLYALDTTFDLPITTNASDLQATMQNHILKEAQLMGTYRRQS